MWESDDEAVIRKSFEVCGISTVTNDSGDDLLTDSLANGPNAFKAQGVYHIESLFPVCSCSNNML